MCKPLFSTNIHLPQCIFWLHLAIYDTCFHRLIPDMDDVCLAMESSLSKAHLAIRCQVAAKTGWFDFRKAAGEKSPPKNEQLLMVWKVAGKTANILNMDGFYFTV